MSILKVGGLVLDSAQFCTAIPFPVDLTEFFYYPRISMLRSEGEP